MSNDDVYAGGLLNRALDPATQPPEIKAFLAAELDLLFGVVQEGMQVLDVGCGTGRHLLLVGIGFDSAWEWTTSVATSLRPIAQPRPGCTSSWGTPPGFQSRRCSTAPSVSPTPGEP